ncbi:uncharacterized protein LOC116948784 isoform X2 [Petromyzon marinus]|uniref:uncharacterized protein LOC116948784 isoform X2 n=1 Tax=Petromyzon marinus TaxID=7757 RepID=UPI003F7117B3
MHGAAESQSQSHADAESTGDRALHPQQASPEKTNLHIKIPKDDVLLKQEKQKRVLSTLEEQEIEHLQATKLHAVEIEAANSSSEPEATVEQRLMLRYRSAASAAKPRDPEPTTTPNGLPGEGHDTDGESAGLAFAATRRQWLLMERQASQTEHRAATPLSPRRTAGDHDAGGGGGPPPGWNGQSGSPRCDGKSSLSRSDDGDDDDGDSGYRFPDSPDDATLADGGSVDLGPDGGGASTGDSAASPGSPRSPRGPRMDCTSPETPIEREIQQSLRREESLRRRRGMAGIACGPGSCVELVEIKTLPALSSRLALPRSPHPLAAPYPSHGRFRLAEQQMYRDIRLETQREEVLVRAGHVRGQYDRGAAQELGLLKKIFEQPEPPLSPTTPKACQPSTNPDPVRQSSRERLLLEPASENVVIVEHNLLQPQGRTGAPLTSTPHRAARSLEWDTGNVIILESRIGVWDKEPAMPTPPEPPTSPPGGGPSPFGPSPRRANDTLSLVEREIREAHRRDDELRRQRQGVYGTAGKPGSLPQGGSPLNPAAGDHARRATVGATPTFPASPASPNSHAAESKAITNGQDNQHPAQHRDPSPGSKSDSAQDSPGGRRSPRKSAMALRWEAGIFANHQGSLD